MPAFFPICYIDALIEPFIKFLYDPAINVAMSRSLNLDLDLTLNRCGILPTFKSIGAHKSKLVVI